MNGARCPAWPQLGGQDGPIMSYEAVGKRLGGVSEASATSEMTCTKGAELLEASGLIQPSNSRGEVGLARGASALPIKTRLAVVVQNGFARPSGLLIDPKPRNFEARRRREHD